MKIGELAKTTGLAPSRIRFYESVGLLRMVERRPNGYRVYPPDARVVLELIAAAQKAGFSLEEIRTMLPSDLGRWEHDVLIATLQRKVADIETLERSLAESKCGILKLIEEIQARPGDVDCAANARKVAARLVDGKAASPATKRKGVRLADPAGRRGSVAAAGTARPSARASRARRSDSDESPVGRRR